MFHIYISLIFAFICYWFQKLLYEDIITTFNVDWRQTILFFFFFLIFCLKVEVDFETPTTILLQ